MSEKDLQKLQDLANDKLEKGVTKAEALRSLINAGILNKKGKFTKQYQTLAGAVKQSPLIA